MSRVWGTEQSAAYTVCGTMHRMSVYNEVSPGGLRRASAGDTPSLEDIKTDGGKADLPQRMKTNAAAADRN